MVGTTPIPTRAVLWELCKAQARAMRQLRQENIDVATQAWALSSEVSHLQGEVGRLLRDLTAWRADHAALCAERDTIARESSVRETEILELIHERDHLTARLSDLDTPGGEVGR